MVPDNVQTMRIKMRKPAAIVLDIEGTTTDISYLSKELFPFIKNHLNTYLMEHWGSDEVLELVDKLRQQAERETRNGINLPKIRSESSLPNDIIDSVVNNVFFQMNNKRTNKELREIQINVWVYGYEKGLLRGHVFEDVPSCMKKWKEQQIRMFVYSSGMERVQKLLFANSTHGDLHKYIERYFDTTSGRKDKPESYQNIAKEIEVSPERILYLSDNPKEVKAARSAGLKSIVVIRPGNKPLNEEDKKNLHIIDTFADLDFGQYK